MDTPEPTQAPRPRLLSDLIDPDRIAAGPPRGLGGLSGGLLRRRLLAGAADVPLAQPVVPTSTKTAPGPVRTIQQAERGDDEPVPVREMNLTQALDAMLDTIADLRDLVTGLEDQCDRLGVPIGDGEDDGDPKGSPETLMEQARDRLSALLGLRDRLGLAVASLEGL